MKLWKGITIFCACLTLFSIGFAPMAEAVSTKETKDSPLFRETLDRSVSKMEKSQVVVRQETAVSVDPDCVEPTMETTDP